MTIRRVATPDGARYYGLPIGTPIAADLQRKVMKLKGTPPEGALTEPGAPLARPEVTAHRVKGTPAPQKVQGWTQYSGPDVMKAIVPPQMANNPSVQAAGKSISRAFVKGDSVVLSEAYIPDVELAKVLAAFDFAVSTQPPGHKGGVMLVIPKHDPQFEDDAGTGGYVVPGIPYIFLNPQIAGGVTWLADDSHPPVYTDNTLQAVIVHEMGHVVDNNALDTMEPPQWNTLDRDDLKFWRDQYKHAPKGWQYGMANPPEGYAEAYVQWTLGGPGSSSIADAYAERYGWARAA